jgi:hypothetical protein
MRPSLWALAVTLFLRLFYSLAAALLPNSRLADPRLAASNTFAPDGMPPSWDWPYLVYGVWERFDSLWYVHIALHGYDRAQATVFYPLYPILIRCLTPVAREPFIAALLLSTAGSFFLFWGVQKLFLLDEQPRAAGRALLFLAVWPASFVLFAAYPDSLVVALIVWSIYFARRGAWWLASALGLFAGLTKAAGLLVCVPLAILILQQRTWRRIPSLAVAAAGAPLYLVWVRMSGLPSVSDTYAAAWKTSVAFPWETLAAAIREAIRGRNLLLELNLAAIAAVALAVLAARPAGIKRSEYIGYSAAALALFLAKQTNPLLQSSMRYLLAVFPLFLVCARLVKWSVAASLASLALFSCNLILFGVFLGWGLVV